MLHQLADQVNSCELIKPLLPKKTIYISCEYNNKSEYYMLNLSGLQPMKKVPEKWHVKILSNEKEMNEFIDGKLRLQQLMKLNVLQVEGRFRDILRLEAMIALSTKYSEDSLTSDKY